jgi:hypothetical protein
VQEILINGSQFVRQRLVQIVDDFYIAFHVSSISGWCF